MRKSFAETLTEGGHTNSLGRAVEVINAVLQDESRLEELYRCLFNEDAWVRMRAVDSLEKICRVHPGWLTPYIDRFAEDLSVSTQPSIQWHLAQMYGQLELTKAQTQFAINWLKQCLTSTEVDWIVAANAMVALVQFVHKGSAAKSEVLPLLKKQQKHKSAAVVKRANGLLEELASLK